MGTPREVFDRGHDLFNRHDVDGLMDLYADNAGLKGPGGMTFKGKDAIAQFARGWIQGFPDCLTTSTNVIEAGSTIVEELRQKNDSLGADAMHDVQRFNVQVLVTGLQQSSEER